jgi:hypothetical protein
MNAGKNITTLIKALPDPLLAIQPTKTAVEKDVIRLADNRHALPAHTYCCACAVDCAPR